MKKSELYSDEIKNIINKAILLKENGIPDLEIAKIVHINLGKILIYDNNYSSKHELTQNEKETRIKYRKKKKFT